ncbi:hypothetical protein NMY22_g8363 [Coprinellus aureogranulatus]|nr:hypothetical protein NMY22_g8363 [Coprinellus aureogranulatus]
MASSSDLPIEIWRTILLLVPPDEGRTLHAVNRMFFEIIMAHRYQVAHWGYHWLDDGRRYRYTVRHVINSPSGMNNDIHQTSHYSSPLVSQYIEKLAINLLLFRLFEPPVAKAKPRCLPFGVGRRRETQPLDLPTLADDDLQSLVDFLAAPVDLSTRFPSLQQLSVMALEKVPHYHHFQAIFKSPFHHALQGIAGTLRIIILQIPLEFYRDGIFSCDITFPLLEEFDAVLFAAYLTTDHERIYETCITPFINRHSPSLSKLSFSLVRPLQSCPWYFYTTKGLFGGLSHIPNLSSFSLDWLAVPVAGAGLDEVGRFIHAHSSSLSSISLFIHSSPRSEYGLHSPSGDDASDVTLQKIRRCYTPSTLFRHQVFRQAISSCRALKTLHLKLLDRDSFQIDPVPFVAWFPTCKFSETITSLKLADNWFNLADLVKVVSSVTLPSLQELWIRCSPLTMTLFDVFAGNLRSLRVLRLGVSAIASRENPSEIEASKMNLISYI